MIQKKIKDLTRLKAKVSRCKKRGERIVFTNGCFDLLHPGHLYYLEKAKSLGDRLIVAVNSDRSVKKIKGGLRPVMPEKQRAALLAGLACVDYVIIFSAPTPLALIKALRPQVLVKGGDWRKKDIVGSEFVRSYKGKVVNCSFLKGYSSSAIIARIRRGRR